ncbi:MAG: hypothetical protein A3K19_20705 [Lentisphaerae bacterium RIFOXYB12_FULL_65_16]|nr:MAG: hypothetical protein A3K18_17595 [Lentisphaerae bacterium RIFOXYA12_64_32]OGV89419.1 MAG: hypothetical protein A3K19_20705 [Lentisphaerae bacterium RIFOXYB12_FULL_65_16]
MRIRWLCLTGVAVTVLAVPMSRSQPAIPAERAVPAAPAKVQEGGDRGDFPALEEIKRRQKELERQKVEQRRKKQLDDIRLLVKRASLQDSDDEKVRGYLQAQDLLQKIWAEKPEPQLKKELELVERKIREVPPPRQFTDATGLSMVLVESEKNSFYISQAPVSEKEYGHWVKVTGGQGPDMLPDTPIKAVTWDKANEFCRWVTDQNRQVFSLPTLEEMRSFKRRLPVAVWTSSVWEGTDITVRRMRERFAVSMYSVWDPALHMASGEAFGELPFATYPQIGFVVVASKDCGIQDRLNRLKGKTEK